MIKLNIFMNVLFFYFNDIEKCGKDRDIIIERYILVYFFGLVYFCFFLEKIYVLLLE